jgi:hypothetical protein
VLRVALPLNSSSRPAADSPRRLWTVRPTSPRTVGDEADPPAGVIDADVDKFATKEGVPAQFDNAINGMVNKEANEFL